MKIYNSSMNIATIKEYHRRFPDTKLNVLRSFGMLDAEVYDICTKYRGLLDGLILDSGTWTRNNAKSEELRKRITFDNYIHYLQSLGRLFDFYFNFDEDFTSAGFGMNYTNQLILEKRGLQPVPVVHDINGPEIPTYINRGYKRVALGSTQIKSVRTMAKVMEQFEGTGIKIHLFGNTSFNLLASFPIDSCDTAMWARDGGWGHIRYWNPKKKDENKTDRIYLDERLQGPKGNAHSFSSYEFREDLNKFLDKTFKLTHNDLIGSKGASNKRLVNTHYLVQLEEIITRIHTRKGF